MKTFLTSTSLLLAFLMSPFSIDAQTLEYGTDPDTSFSFPYAPVSGGEDLDFTSYPQVDTDFITRYAMRFTPSEDGVLDSLGVYFESRHPEEEDSTQYFYNNTGDDDRIGFNKNLEGQEVLSIAGMFTSPYVGYLDSLDVRLSKDKVLGAYDDDLRISFLKPSYNVGDEARILRYYKEGTVWAFSIPRITENVTVYGARFTGPAGKDSLLLAETRFYVHGINDFNNQGWVSGFDTPANDTLLVHFYSIAESDSLPDQKILTRKKALSDLSAGFFNSVNVRDDSLYIKAGQEIGIGFETMMVDNQDFIWLLSGQSYETPLNRTFMYENGSWVYISESASWGDSQAKGAEIQVEAVLEGSFNRLAPDSTSSAGKSFDVPLSELTDDEFNTIKLPEPVRLFRGESVWVVYSLNVTASNDQASLYTDNSIDGTENQQRTAVLLDQDTTSTWTYIENVLNTQNNIALQQRAHFSREMNDRVYLSLHQNSLDNLPGEELEQVSVQSRVIPVGEPFYVDVRTWQQDISSENDFHVSVSHAVIQQSDGFSIGAEQTDVTSRASIYVENDGWSSMETQAYGSGKQLLMSAHYSIPTNTEKEEPNSLPDQLSINKAYPNPFNPTTTISFSVPETQDVTIEIYNITGQQVAMLVNEQIAAGEHQVTWDATAMSSGIYIVRLTGAQTIETRKITLIK